MRWLKLVEGCYKINIDSTFNNFNAGCGDLISDSKGHIIVAFVGPSNSSSVIMAEHQALKYGLQLCISLGITNI